MADKVVEVIQILDPCTHENPSHVEAYVWWCWRCGDLRIESQWSASVWHLPGKDPEK